MPLNLLKKYPDLLDVVSLAGEVLKASLRRIFNRDIVENTTFSFRGKKIFPIKADGELDLQREFLHLTTHVEQEENGTEQRYFDRFRSERLHWIRPHAEEMISDSNIEVFSLEERDFKKRQTIVRTYVYNTTRKYVVVFEPQRNGTAYYLLTAYYLDKPYGEKQMQKRLKQKLNEIK